MPRRILMVISLLLAAAGSARAQRILFDASHGETAGNADWIVDADTSLQYWDNFECQPGELHHSAQRWPTPDQSLIDAMTDETFWDGAISAWAVDLAQDALLPERGRSWTIEQYPWDAPPFTYGDPTQPQDLSGYDVLVLAEPNVIFSAAEIQAIRDFVWNGGGLFLIADHETSDRNCSNGEGNEVHDSPFILNQLMGTSVATSPTPPYVDLTDPSNDFGEFGIWFYENGNDDPDDGANREFDWFTEEVNDNVSTDPTDPIVVGPFGDGSGGLGLFGSTQIAVSIDPTQGNPTARAHIWRNGQDPTANTAGVFERVTFASALYGAGRVVAIGDSSPADDGTGEGVLFDGWDKAEGGVANDVLHLNATEWLADPEPDLSAPVLTFGPEVEAEDCTAVVLWSTDELATSTVTWGVDAQNLVDTTVPGFVRDHAVELTGLLPDTTYLYQVASDDPFGNGPTLSVPDSFATSPTAPPQLEGDPTVAELTDTRAVVSWQTDEPTDAVVEYGTTPELGQVASVAERSTAHEVALEGLSAETTYYFRVGGSDGCGLPLTAAIDSFTTAPTPDAIDLDGWQLINTNPQFELTFPAGTTVPAGGYLVIGRDDDQAGFEQSWGPLPAEAIYLDSQDTLLVNGTARPYTLLDAGGTVVDGPTIEVRSGQSIARLDACGDPSAASSWQTRSDAEADPGAGAPPACGAGVVIVEMSDADTFQHEFVELYYDAALGSPDEVAPDAVLDLVALPLGPDTVELSWTAPGDDGSVGTADRYEIRTARLPIRGDIDWDTAAPVAGAPRPGTAGTSEVATAGDLSPDTVAFFAVRAVDEAGNRSPIGNSPAATTAPGGGTPMADHLLLSEIQGGSSSAATDEFIELYNPTDIAVPVTGWSVQYKSATGSTYLVVPLPATTVAPYGHLLVAHVDYDGAESPDVVYSSFSISGTSGNVYLADTTQPLGQCSGSGLVDRIAYGSGDCPEGSAAPALTDDSSLERRPGTPDGKGQDTDHNAADLFLQPAPGPQNLTRTEPPSGGPVGNVGNSLHRDGAEGFRWAAAFGATGYPIRRGDDPQFLDPLPPPWVTVTDTTWTDPELPPPGGCFYYDVRATDGTQESED